MICIEAGWREIRAAIADIFFDGLDRVREGTPAGRRGNLPGLVWMMIGQLPAFMRLEVHCRVACISSNRIVHR